MLKEFKSLRKIYPKQSRRVFAAMSGGVDSSVAALLLKKQGYEVIGVFMRCFNVDGCAERDSEDARRVAEKLKIPFYVWDFEDEYKNKVVEYIIDGYRRGVTPNPDVMCNKEIKFGLFLKKALEMGADYVATGHYVKLVLRKNPASSTRSGRSSGDLRFSSRRQGFDRSIMSKPPSSPAWKVSERRLFSLAIARDRNKDQSYFLWTLTQEQLKHCLFPVGDYLKSEVREMAREAGLPTAGKKDSQGICFLGKVTLGEFLANYIPEKRGRVIDVAGKAIGEHKGAQFYTIGQRHIGIGNRRLTRAAHGTTQARNMKPLYITEKDIKTNTLVAVEGSDNPALHKKEIELKDVNFIRPDASTLISAGGGQARLLVHRENERITVLARVRYRQPLSPATLELKNSKTSKLIFDEPQKFVAPGQSAVFYSKNGELLGGGVIL